MSVSGKYENELKSKGSNKNLDCFNSLASSDDSAPRDATYNSGEHDS